MAAPEYSYVEKLRMKFKEVQAGKLPPDEAAMSELRKELESIQQYVGGTGMTQFRPFPDASKIVLLIAKIVDGRFERILDALEHDCCKPSDSKT